MTRGFVVALMLASAPAEAACHKFSIWKYPTPQRCGVYARVSPRPAPQPERVNLEITITPELLETWDRQDALARLRGELK